jgi:hypothetical protein
MKTSGSFIRVFIADLIKYRKSLVPWITLLYPLFTVALITIINIGMRDLPERPLFDFSRNFLWWVLSFYILSHTLITQVNFLKTAHRDGTDVCKPVRRAVFLLSKIRVFISCAITFLLIKYLLFCHPQTWDCIKELLFLRNETDFSTAMGKLLVVYLSDSLMMSIQFYLPSG